MGRNGESLLLDCFHIPAAAAQIKRNLHPLVSRDAEIVRAGSHFSYLRSQIPLRLIKNEILMPKHQLEDDCVALMLAWVNLRRSQKVRPRVGRRRRMNYLGELLLPLKVRDR